MFPDSKAFMDSFTIFVITLRCFSLSKKAHGVKIKAVEE